MIGHLFSKLHHRHDQATPEYTPSPSYSTLPPNYAAEPTQLLSIEYGVSRVIGGREYQEDEYACVDHLTRNGGPAFFAIFDGHGSDYYSAHASINIYKKILDNPRIRNGGNDIDEAIRQAFAEEDATTLNDLKVERGKTGGCTATVAIIQNNELHVGNVGDSTAVLAVERNNKIVAVRMSLDHKPDDPEERLRIESVGGVVRGGRVCQSGSAINMSRALGDHEFKTPLNEAPGDFITGQPFISPTVRIDQSVKFIILASDGLWNTMADQEVVDTVADLKAKGAKPEEITDKITKRCAMPMAADNTTMIAVFFHHTETDRVDAAPLIPSDATVENQNGDDVLISKHTAKRV